QRGRQLDLAHDGDAARHRCGERRRRARNARARHDEPHPVEQAGAIVAEAQLDASPIARLDAERRGVAPIADPHDDTARAERTGHRPTGGREPDHERARGQRHQRNLSVASASRAQTMATIQKRTMICGSGQPSSSKWWWMGAMRKMRLRRSLYEATCPITDSASATKTAPTSRRTISCRVTRATRPSAAPSASEPTSPMNICAGYALYQRNPIPAAASAPQNTASSPAPATYGIWRYSAMRAWPAV